MLSAIFVLFHRKPASFSPAAPTETARRRSSVCLLSTDLKFLEKSLVILPSSFFMATDERAVCAISQSQEQEFRRTGFLTDSDSSVFSAVNDEPLDFSVSGTPIIMVSLPESPEQGAAAEGQFETPPEDFASADGSQSGRCSETVPTIVHRDSVAMASEAGHDADLGISKVIHTVEVVSSESKDSGIQKRGSSSDSESPLKRSKLAPSDSFGVKVASLGLPSHVVELMEFFHVLVPKSAVDVPSPSGEENTGRRAVDIGVGETAQNVVEAGGDSGGRKAGKTKGSLKQDLLAMVEATMRATGQLPPKNGAQQANSRDSCPQRARSILEIAKSRGLKFPRPEHWPPEKEL